MHKLVFLRFAEKYPKLRPLKYKNGLSLNTKLKFSNKAQNDSIM